MDVKTTPCQCTNVRVDKQPFSVTATLHHVGPTGLTKAVLLIDGKPVATRWIWMRAGDTREVAFTDLPSLDPGQHALRCGDVSISYGVDPSK
jgi:hypothetical protein